MNPPKTATDLVKREALSFTLARVATAADLQRACSVRAAAYGRLLPELHEALSQPDALDGAHGTAVFLCVDKASDRPIGTVRIQVNHEGPLALEASCPLPHSLRDKRLAEITRLAAVPGAEPRVKLALMKTAYLVCLDEHIEWMVVGARREVLLRQYRRLGFCDVYPDDRRVPLAHAANLPHAVLCFDVPDAERMWRSRHHPLYGFMVQTEHPDLRLGDVAQTRSVPSMLSTASLPVDAPTR